MARTQEELEGLVQEILGDAYHHLSVSKYMLNEDIEAHTATIVCALVHRGGEEGPVERAVEGVGVGMIDALFKGLKRSLSPDYPSIEHIHFVDFSISGDFDGHPETDSRSDAHGRVRLVVENTSGRHFSFESSSRSISASSVQAVVKAVEHFVNAELAVLRVYDWIDDAKRRSRPDLADRYTQRLADLVSNASYSDSIERKKASTGL